MSSGQVPWGEGHHEGYSELFDRTAGMVVICEDLPEEHNRVTLDPELTDSDGIPAPKLSYTLSENSRKMLDHSVARGTEVLEAAVARRLRPERLADGVVSPPLAGPHLGQPFPGLRHTPRKQVLRHPEVAVPHQAFVVLVAPVEDLDPHIAVLDHVARLLAEEQAPDLHGRGVDLEGVAVILHRVPPRPA